MQRLTKFLLINLLSISIFFFNSLTAQSLLPQLGAITQGTEADTVVPQVKAIPMNEINNASTEAFTLYSRAGNTRLKPESRNTITISVDSMVSQITSFLSDTVGVNFYDLNFREIDAQKNVMFLLLDRLAKTQEMISRPLTDIQKQKRALDLNRRKWVLTLDKSNKENSPDAIRRRISGVIRQNDSVSFLLQEDMDFLLTQSDKITSQQINLDQFSIQLEAYNKLTSDRILRRDMPPIWSSFTERDSAAIIHEWTNFKTVIKSDSNLIITKYSTQLVIFIILFILIVILVFWTRATTKEDEISGKKVILSLYLNEIFRKPVEISLLLGLYLLSLLIPEMPEIFSSILAVITVFAVLRVAFDILPTDYRKHLLEFAGAFILLNLYNLFYDQHLYSRSVLLISQLIVLLFLVRFLIGRTSSRLYKSTLINYFLTGLSGLFVIFLILSSIGNILGILSLSEFLTSGVIESTFLVLTTYVGFHVSAAVIYLLLSSGLLQKSNIVKRQFKYIYRKIYSLLQAIFMFSYVVIALSFFNIKQPVFDWVSEFLNHPIHIGQAIFSLINIILFVFVIWLSIFISRVVRHILQEEVFTRVKAERGVPSTIIMLLRIALISIGFLLAATAAGMKLSSLTIIIGAFSVGIGFGLQNIFNNLVSGLILAFERPIKEGDTVEVKALLGVVKKIGIRSSVVRTYDGAEVIVPNGELISNELINWTLSDVIRRLDIRIGVAYGTDPDKVLNILLEVAKSDKNVNTDPAPKAFFIGFGESSLDFRLLIWSDQELRLEVESELRLEINRKILEAGIQIPFPQRDVHIKSEK